MNARYTSIHGYGDPQKRYHAYLLANEGSPVGSWPGEWWKPVYPPWGTDSVMEYMLVEWLQETYPDREWAIQEVVWVAEPTRWRESNGSTTYLGKGWDLK